MANVPAKGFKVVSLAIVLLLSGLTSPAFQDLISQYPEIYNSVVAVAIVILRAMTTTSIFKKD